MEIITLNDIDIESITKELQNGKTIVYPTETCYGLGCDAANRTAVDRIFDIKRRQRDKPLLMIAHDLSAMMRYIEWDDRLADIARRYWPGPLTVVVPVKKDADLAQGVIAEDGTIAFRVSRHPVAGRLSFALGRPLVSTSANIAARESPYDIRAVLDMFEHSDSRPDMVIDAGELPHEAPSTIVRLADDEFEIVRQGEVIVEVEHTS